MLADTLSVMSRKLLIILASLALCGCAAPEALPTSAHNLVDIDLPSETRIVSDRVARGATLASLLREHAIAETEIHTLVARAASVFDLRKVRAGQPYKLAQAIDGAVRRFEYEIDLDRTLRLERIKGNNPDVDFEVEIAPIEKEARTAIVRGGIDEGASSLFAAMDRAGESVELTLKLADVFSSEVDFNSEVQPGDRFELLVDKLYRTDDADEAFAGYGPVVAAEFVNDGRRLRAFHFTPDGGSAGYFSEDGRSLRRFFLRSPLKFDPVVTSGFSRSRRHPVLHVQRAHLGVDYRAPTGAPVIAVSNGVVVSAGWSGGSGRMVHLRHANGYETQYLHLSSIAVRRGARVAQGDLIGRVGSSGLATGPHLDYRVRKNGSYLNPVVAHRAMPPGDPIPDDQMPAFVEARDRALAMVGSDPLPVSVATETASSTASPQQSSGQN